MKYVSLSVHREREQRLKAERMEKERQEQEIKGQKDLKEELMKLRELVRIWIYYTERKASSLTDPDPTAYLVLQRHTFWEVAEATVPVETFITLCFHIHLTRLTVFVHPIIFT